LWRTGQVAAAKGLEVDRALGACVPLPQCRDALAVMRRHDEVVSLRNQTLGRQPAPAAGFGIDFDRATEADRVANVGAQNFPVVAGAHPVVGLFDLPAVANGLREHAVLVAQAVAERRQAEFGARVEKTCCQPPQTAVAERCVFLVLEQIGQRLADGRELLAHRAFEAECRQCVAERAAHQKFHRQVMHAPRTARGHGPRIVGLGLRPALRQQLATRAGRRTQARAAIGAAARLAEFANEGGLQRGGTAGVVRGP
jgi:hypothetical protein